MTMTMTMAQGAATIDARVDVRRLGVATVDGRGPVAIALRLPVAARLAEAERLLPTGVRLLVLGTTPEGDAVDVTLADRRGDPMWMGALPVLVAGTDGPVAFAPERDEDGDRNRRAIREALVTVGLRQDPAVWFRWSIAG